MYGGIPISQTLDFSNLSIDNSNQKLFPPLYRTLQFYPSIFPTTRILFSELIAKKAFRLKTSKGILSESKILLSVSL